MQEANNMNLAEVKKIISLLGDDVHVESSENQKPTQNPMLGRNCLVRTYSAGLDWGKVDWICGNQVHLTSPSPEFPCRKIWNWNKGGLSALAIATVGMQGGKTDHASEVFITEAIELIPTTPDAEKTYGKFHFYKS